MSPVKRVGHWSTASGVWASIKGGAMAVAGMVLLTLVLSLMVCLGLHPEAALAAEWATPIAALLWAGAMMRKDGRLISLCSGLTVSIVWIIMWLIMVGRLSPRLWIADGPSLVTWRHLAAWACGPLFGFLGGEIGPRLERSGKIGRIALHAFPPLFVIVVGLVITIWVPRAGDYVLADGVTLSLRGPDKDGNTTRLFTFDFTKNPDLQPGIYDCDSDDSTPFDNHNMSFLATPAQTVYEKLGANTLFVVNAGYYNWLGPWLLGSHVAPMVENGRAHYNVYVGPTPSWTFGWKTTAGKPRFQLVADVPFKKLTPMFDWAFCHVRPLVVDGRPQDLGLGPGLTFLNCSRVSVGWSDDSSKLYILVVRGRDSERASTARWRVERRKTSGWDLLRLERYWSDMGVKNAIALDGGDSTQVVYRGRHRVMTVAPGRYAFTFGYLLDKPVRFWFPVFPTRHSHMGVMNFIYVKQVAKQGGR